MKQFWIFVIGGLIMINSGCESHSSESWINNKIQEITNQSVNNPPTEIWEYQFQGKKVFYFTPRCCDMFSELYDDKGELICSPDGGITGRGDGRCPDFNRDKLKGRLVWKDDRQR